MLRREALKTGSELLDGILHRAGIRHLLLAPLDRPDEREPRSERGRISGFEPQRGHQDPTGTIR